MTALSKNLRQHLTTALANGGAAKELLAMLAPGVGEIPSVSGLSVSELGIGAVRKTVITLDEVELTITDADVAGAHGTQKLYDFPEGHIKILGAHAQYTAIVAGSGGIGDAGVVDIGVGSAAVSTADETLATTEQNIVTKADVTLSGGSGTGDAVNSTDTTLDGSTTPVDAHLNVAITAATASASDTLTVSGTVTIHWMLLGDD